MLPIINYVHTKICLIFRKKEKTTKPSRDPNENHAIRFSISENLTVKKFLKINCNNMTIYTLLGCNVPFSDAVLNLGKPFTTQLKYEKHTSQMVKIA